MYKSLFITLTTLLAFHAGAGCLTSTLEIGDTGPDDAVVCDEIESLYPGSEVAILDRTIHSANRMSVAIELDGKRQDLVYRLSGFQWRLTATGMMARQ